MLVLSRKAREELIFPQYGIVVTILEVHGNRVRVGIAAPKEVQVLRREVWGSAQAKDRSQKAGSKVDGLAVVSETDRSETSNERSLLR